MEPARKAGGKLGGKPLWLRLEEIFQQTIWILDPQNTT